MSEQDKFFAELRERERRVAIRFGKGHYDLGMYLLTEHSGGASVVPLYHDQTEDFKAQQSYSSTAFVVKNTYFQQAVHDFLRAEVDFEYYDLPWEGVGGFRLTRNLGLQEGWKKPVQEQSEQ